MKHQQVLAVTGWQWGEKESVEEKIKAVHQRAWYSALRCTGSWGRRDVGGCVWVWSLGCVCIFTSSLSVPQLCKTRITVLALSSHRNAQGGSHEITGVKVLWHMRRLHRYNALSDISAWQDHQTLGKARASSHLYMIGWQSQVWVLEDQSFHMQLPIFLQKLHRPQTTSSLCAWGPISLATHFYMRLDASFPATEKLLLFLPRRQTYEKAQQPQRELWTSHKGRVSIVRLKT